VKANFAYNCLFSITGAAAGILLLLNGDILGCSGIVSSAVVETRKTLDTKSWMFLFAAAFIGTSNLYFWAIDSTLVPSNSNLVRFPSTFGFIIAGFFVGLGTKLSNGCTSGHGICGMARFSLRSFVAVGTFMIVAVIVASVMGQEAVYNAFGFLHTDNVPSAESEPYLIPIFAVPFTLLAIWSLVTRQDGTLVKKSLGAILGGIVFAFGLGLSGMVEPSKVLNFLDLSALARKTYDPTLMTVMAAGVVVSFASYMVKQYYMEKPVMAKTFCVPTNKVIDVRLVLGAALFGIGWGLAGLCPAPALYWAAVGVPQSVYMWMPGYILGAMVVQAWMWYTQECTQCQEEAADEPQVDSKEAEYAVGSESTTTDEEAPSKEVEPEVHA
jgi:uncharacterized membrane protein YedE/YeeE